MNTQQLMYLFRFLLLTALLNACGNAGVRKPVRFETLTATETGITFTNKLTSTPGFNMLRYMYFYNGAGAGAGDFNNDGFIDLFFASNQGRNSLYLNKGQMQFRDVTQEAGIPDDGGWSTGVSVADINNDGLLDIYVCRVGNYESLKSMNQLLICTGINQQGVPQYRDEAAARGVQFSGFSTQAVFFDADLDNDLDLFLLNHSLRYNSTFAPRTSYAGTSDPLSKDIFYRNDGGHFTDVSAEAGILQSVIGYGLGVVVSDFNMDGWPDLYVGNDFHENDYLYINNQHGGFTEELTSRLMHTSQFSMGVDAGDINNDGWPDIVSADMLPDDSYILRRSLGEDEYETFLIKIRNQYNYQYARNNLQLNRRNGLFSEIGLYAGIAATDWSWSTLWMDFDNDGWKDLFVSNGIPKRLNDIDYVNYVSNAEIQQKIRAGQMKDRDMALIDKFPEIKLPNRFFLNKGDASFTDAGEQVDRNTGTFSNGAVYADLDNDGDLDIVVNNIEDPVIVYRNTANDDSLHPALQLALTGPSGNRNAVGSRVLLFAAGETLSFEKFQARGFQSSMEIPLHIAAGNRKIDSAVLIWPDNSYQPLDTGLHGVVKMQYKPGLPVFDFAQLRQQASAGLLPSADITPATGVFFRHEENVFNEFDREPLLPFMISKEGPALCVADINQDGLSDFFTGSSKWEHAAVFLQQPGNRFVRMQQPALDADSTYEDTDACWADINNDNLPDLIVASGGNEFYGQTPYLVSRVYLNRGGGKLERLASAIPADLRISASCVVPVDFNNDGSIDLFIGGRAVPWQYGTIPPSALLQNDGKGHFTDVTTSVAPALASAGFVKSAVSADIQQDGKPELIVAYEWGGICAWTFDKNRVSQQWLTERKGWWNFIRPVDIDLDGDIDFIAGNQGRNSRFRASAEEPVRLYYTDFDDNGKKDQVVSYYLQGQEIPFANKAELERQMPKLKKKYLYAEDFARANLTAVFGADKLKSADVFSADYLENALLINDGKGGFALQALPWEAQLTSYRDAAVADLNGDGLPDILLAGNFYANNIQMGRYDADFGSCLLNMGNARFRVIQQQVPVKGEIRKIALLSQPGQALSWVMARNDDSLRIYQLPPLRKPGSTLSAAPPDHR